MEARNGNKTILPDNSPTRAQNTELKNFSNFADLKKYVFKEPGKEDLAKFAG